jgi:DNA replication protein DnaC
MATGDGVYILNTNIADVIIPCPVCSVDRRKQWITKHCGMVDASERALRLHHWKTPLLSPEQRKQRDIARQMMLEAIEHQTGLYTYWGDFGAGKTMAIQIVVNELRENNTVEGFYAPFAVVLDHLRRMYATGNEADDFWSRLLTIPVLALDEVTRFRQENSWQQHMLFVLVDTRYRRRNSHLTLFATNDDPRKNLPPSDDQGHLFSRMREGRLIELRGDVRRAE